MEVFENLYTGLALRNELMLKRIVEKVENFGEERGRGLKRQGKIRGGKRFKGPERGTYQVRSPLYLKQRLTASLMMI